MPIVLDPTFLGDASDPATPPERLLAIFREVGWTHVPQAVLTPGVPEVLRAIGTNPNLDLDTYRVFLQREGWLEVALANPMLPFLVLTDGLPREAHCEFFNGIISTYFLLLQGQGVAHDLAWSTYHHGRALGLDGVFLWEWKEFRDKYKREYTVWVLGKSMPTTSLGGALQAVIAFEAFRRENAKVYARRASGSFAILTFYDRLRELVGEGV